MFRRELTAGFVAACMICGAFAHEQHQKAMPGEGVKNPEVSGAHPWQFRAVPSWGQLPDGKPVGPLHGGIAVDPQTGWIYVATDAKHGILVYQPDGSFVKSIAPACSGMHAIEAGAENGKTVLYGAQLRGATRVCKLDTEGNILLEISAKTNPDLRGGWKGLTAVTVAPDGSIFCAMGYGSQLIHKFDAAGKHVKSFGGHGSGQAVLTNRAHGLKVDPRFTPARLLVCDRENRRLFHTDLEGNWIGEITTGLRRPCAVSIYGDVCAVAELEGRVCVIDQDGQIVSLLGDNPDRSQWARFQVPPEAMQAGVFTAPHGLSFAHAGNLYVQDWNRTGRITKLTRTDH